MPVVVLGGRRRPVTRASAATVAPVGPGRLRKVAIIGTAQSIDCAPWHDASWEIWAHSSAWRLAPRVDRYFDLHPKEVWQEKKSWHPNYQQWLASLRVPIYMQDEFAEVPTSVRYPKDRVLSEFRRYATSQAAWMIALALTEGVTHLGFFGVHYGLGSEYRTQRPGCEYWMGVAEGRGVQLVIPEHCPLLREPKWLYGYESHTPERIAARQKAAKAMKTDPDGPPQPRVIVPIEGDVMAVPERFEDDASRQRMAELVAMRDRFQQRQAERVSA